MHAYKTKNTQQEEAERGDGKGGDEESDEEEEEEEDGMGWESEESEDGDEVRACVRLFGLRGGAQRACCLFLIVCVCVGGG